MPGQGVRSWLRRTVSRPCDVAANWIHLRLTSLLLNFDPYGGTTGAQNSGGTGYTQSPYT